MIDWDKPIQTKDGAPARVLSRDFMVGGEPCIAVQIDRDGYSYLCTFGIGADASVGEDALRNVKVKKEGWVLMRPYKKTMDSRYLVNDQVYNSETDAQMAMAYYSSEPEIKPVYLTWEE
jgi:hypothetical protein